MTTGYTLAFSAIVLVFAIPDQANAQIKVVFDAGFPKAGAVKGQIAVQGTINIPAGLTGQTSGSGRIFVSPVGGGLKQTFSLTIGKNLRNNVPWSGTATGLGGPNYNVIVEVDVDIAVNNTKIYVTDPKQSPPK